MGFGEIYRTTIQVEPCSSNTTVNASDIFKLFANEGATSLITFSLPAAQVSRGPFLFLVQNSNGIKIQAASGDTIRVGTSVSSAGGSISSTTVGAAITLVAINDTEWVAIATVEAW